MNRDTSVGFDFKAFAQAMFPPETTGSNSKISGGFWEEPSGKAIHHPPGLQPGIPQGTATLSSTSSVNGYVSHPDFAPASWDPAPRYPAEITDRAYTGTNTFAKRGRGDIYAPPRLPDAQERDSGNLDRHGTCFEPVRWSNGLSGK